MLSEIDWYTSGTLISGSKRTSPIIRPPAPNLTHPKMETKESSHLLFEASNLFAGKILPFCI